MKSKIMSDAGRENRDNKELRSAIICVDDEKMMLSVLYEQLTEFFGKNYRIEKALSGEEALEIVDRCTRAGNPVSVVISDYLMPVMKGDELLIEIKKKDPRIRKIMLTGYTSVTGIITAINQAGLYRYILKPWDVKDLMLTVMEAIKSYEQDNKMQELAKGFESLYHKNEENIQHMVDVMVSTMQEVNPELATHAMRMKQYALWLANKLELDETIIKNLRFTSVLHDIGKLGKKSAAETKETELMYIETAKKIISHVEGWEPIFRGIQYQYEKYDGSGLYELESKNIPEEARVLAIVDYYDSVKCTPQQENITTEEIIEILMGKRGTWFDPDYLDVFIRLLQPKNIRSD